MNLIAYIRVSTDDQREHGHSVGHQVERLAAWAATNDHEIVSTIIDEGVSGSIPLSRRPGGRDLFRQLRDGSADGVCVTRINRMFRNLLDGIRFFEEDVADLGANIFSLTESISTSTSAGWMSLVMLLAFADYDRRQDVQHAKETIAALKRSGKVYGTVPFGCVSIGGDEYTTGEGMRVRGASLQRDPARWLVRNYIVGLLRAGVTKAEVARRLAKERIAAPRGGKYWQISTLRGLLEMHDELEKLPFAEPESLYGEASCSGRHGTLPLPKSVAGKPRRHFHVTSPVSVHPHSAAALNGAEETGVSHAH
jgi:site-specific DNA recombinase